MNLANREGTTRNCSFRSLFSRGAFLLLVCVFSPGDVWSQSGELAQDLGAKPSAFKELQARRVAANGLRELSPEAVISQYGEPSEKRLGQEGRETWVYGKSVILFREGKVTAWSDAGELGERGNVQGLSLENSRNAHTDYGFVWVNPWTPRKLSGVEEVLQRVVANPIELDKSRSTSGKIPQ